ncbi:MAG TPA: hypothetical protein VGJ19_03905 [Streptosporangiaceae bacterium]
MRYRLMASFQGASYQANVGPADEEVTLFAASPPPEALGFRSSSNHWRKSVRVDDIDALWEARPVGRYRGERCMVLDDLGDRMHIAYLGRDLYLARRLGFWEVDRGVFEVVVPRQDIDDLREERGEYELAGPARNGHNPGGWDRGPLPTWAHTPRDDYRQPAPDTGPLRAVGPHELIDTGPSWAADPRLPDVGAAVNGDARDEHAQDPRDTGTWAAIADPPATREPGGPFPRARGGWQARDTGGWQAPDTGSWDPREVERAAARERAAAGADWGDQQRWGTPGWDASRSAASWGQRDVPVAGAAGAGAAGPPVTGPATGPFTGPSTDSWNANDVTDPGVGNGAWTSPDVAATDPGRWDPQDTMAWSPVTSGEWEHDEPGWNGHPGTGARPAAGWEPPEAARPAYPPQTQDAAAVWHGSPFPEDTGRWNRPDLPPAPGAAPGMAPGPAAGTATGAPAPRYDDPPLARQAAAITGAYAAPTASEVSAPPVPGRTGASPGAPDPLATPGVAGAAAPGATQGAPGGSRYVGRRAARKPRVTTQAIFSQLLDLAAIPQSAYAVDQEVDGAMCLIRARGGYEVFSAADQSRHEVRFFEDEEAAYFYLFGVLAADAIRNGQLGPKG